MLFVDWNRHEIKVHLMCIYIGMCSKKSAYVAQMYGGISTWKDLQRAHHITVNNLLGAQVGFITNKHAIM